MATIGNYELIPSWQAKTVATPSLESIFPRLDSGKWTIKFKRLLRDKVLVLKASEPKVLEAAMSDAAIPKNYSSDAEDLDQSSACKENTLNCRKLIILGIPDLIVTVCQNKKHSNANHSRTTDTTVSSVASFVFLSKKFQSTVTV